MKTTPVSDGSELYAMANKFSNEQRQNGWLLSVATEKQGVAFWDLQRNLHINERTEAYPLLLLDAIYNKNMSCEAEFIQSELKRYYAVLDRPVDELNRNAHAHHNILSYVNFLEQRKLKLVEVELDKKLNDSNKIPTVLSRTELTGLLLFFLKDSGALPEEISDYRFSQWVEKNFSFQNAQEMKYIKQEISKFRRLEYDTIKFIVDIRESLRTKEIKINDELNE